MSTGAPVRLRPLGVGELLDVAIKLCRVHFRTLGRLVLVVSAPLALIGFFVTLGTAGDLPLVSGGLGGFGGAGTADETASGSYVAGQAIVALLALLVLVLTTVACFGAIADAYLGRDTAWRRSLSLAVRKLPATVWLGVVITVGLTLALIALLLPAIWLAVAWSLAVPVMLVEDKGGVRALRRSFGLVRGRWWPTAATLLVATLLSSVLSSVVQGVLVALTVVVLGDDSLLALALTQLTALGVRTFTTPFTAAVVALLYFDLRVRKEAFDLQLLADAMGGGTVGATAGFLPPLAPVRAAATGADAPPFWPPPPGWEPPSGPAAAASAAVPSAAPPPPPPDRP